jgi:hypothetical protein
MPLDNERDPYNAAETPIEWEIAVPLFGNRAVMGDWVKLCVATGIVTGGLLTLLFAIQGEWDAVLSVLLAIGALSLGLFVFGIVVMAVFFGGHMHFKFTLDDQQVRCDMVDRRAKTANRLALVVGVLAGKPGAAGAGAMAMSRESEAVAFSGGFTARFNADSRQIDLRNGWRRLMVVYATPENYAAVAARIEARMRTAGTATRVAAGNPLPKRLALSALIVVATLPVFALVEEYDVDMFAVLLLVCFAMATLWLIRVLGVVVIGVAAVIVVMVAASALEVRESMFGDGQTYRHFEVFNENDVLLLLVAGIGLAVLVGMSVAALRGKLPSMLEADAESAGQA